MGDEASTEEKVSEESEEEARNAREMLDYLNNHVRRGKAMGVEFSEVQNMLTAARIMIESGEFADAIEIISECMLKASERYSEHEILTVSIRKAEREIQAAHNSGKDVAEASKLLRHARLHMEKGNYRLAIDTAKKAQDEVTHKKSGEIIWGSGLSGSD